MGASSDKAIDMEGERDRNLGRMEGKIDLILKDNHVEAFNRRQELRYRLQNCITATEQALKDKRTLESKRQDVQNLQKYLENQFKQAIAEEMIGEKKKYTNQEQRDTALAMKQAEDTEYKGFAKEYIEITQKILENADLLEILKMKFRSAQAEIELEKLEV